MLQPGRIGRIQHVFVLNLSCCLILFSSGYAASPANDECADAIPIAENVPVTGTNVDAQGADLSSCGYLDEHDVWYVYTPSQSGVAVIGLCDGGPLDTVLSVYAACGGQEIACNDDYCGTASQVTIAVMAGTPYYLRVAGYNNSENSFTLRASTHPGLGMLEGVVYSYGVDNARYLPIPGAVVCVLDAMENPVVEAFTGPSGAYRFSLPEGTYKLYVWAHDHAPETISDVVVLGGICTTLDAQLFMAGVDTCMNIPQIFDSETRTGSTSGATGADITSCGTQDTADVWWAYTPPHDGLATFSTCTSDFDTTLALFDACEGTELTCSDDACGTGSEIIFHVRQGVTYFLRVAGNNGASGSYELYVNRIATQHFEFANSRAYINFQWPSSADEIVRLTGSCALAVYYVNRYLGSADDGNGNGRDEVSIFFTDINLTGTSLFAGQITLTLKSSMLIAGIIEEDQNDTSGTLEISPFSLSGTAVSNLIASLEFQISGQALNNSPALNLAGTLTQMPPAPGNCYAASNTADLLDENAQPTGIRVLQMIFEPNPANGEGALDGTVFDADTLVPVSGAIVSLLQGPMEVNTAVTGGDGVYTFIQLPAGTYDMKLTAPGYTEKNVNDVQVIAEVTTTQDILLVPVAPEGEAEGETPVPHPADINEDFRMVLSEAITYLAGWQQGSNPIGYAIRAAYLWQNGENYIHIPEQDPPLCWELANE